MTVKKSTPFTSGRSGEAAPNKPRIKPTTTSRKQDHSQGQGYHHTGVVSSGAGLSKTTREERMYCNDPAQVQQWAADSAAKATGFLDPLSQDHCSNIYGEAPVMTSTSSQLPGSFPMSHSYDSRTSAQPSVPDFETLPGMDHNNLCSIGSTTGLEAALDMQQAPEYGSNFDFTTSQYIPDIWSYPTPSTDSAIYTNFAPVPDSMLDVQGSNPCFQPSWPQMSCSTGDESFHGSVAYTTNPVSESPLSAVDPSVSSSYSQNSFAGPEPDTPISQAIQEGKWSPDLDNGCFQGFSVGESMQFATAMDYNDQLNDGLRSVCYRTTLSKL